MDITDSWRFCLQQPLFDLTGVGLSAFLFGPWLPRRGRRIRKRLLSGVRLLPGIPLLPDIPVLLSGIRLLSAIRGVSAIWVSALRVLRQPLLLGWRTICSAGLLRTM